MVQQGKGYPGGYFDDVPAAKALKDGYLISMRQRSTDVWVMNQVRCDMKPAVEMPAVGFSFTCFAPLSFLVVLWATSSVQAEVAVTQSKTLQTSLRCRNVLESVHI